MKVLIGCEYSGRVREAFRAMGHDAWSCDLLPCDDGSQFHIQGDVLKAIDMEGWDLAIFHPPCTYLSVSGLHHNQRNPERAEKTEEALQFVQKLMDCKIPRWALENPVSCISSRIRKPDQIIQPYWFGDDASKKTCLWLKDLPQLQVPKPWEWAQPRLVVNTKTGKPVTRWANQTDSGQNALPPSEDRWKIRSTTYPGIARAFAENWGRYA